MSNPGDKTVARELVDAGCSDLLKFLISLSLKESALLRLYKDKCNEELENLMTLLDAMKFLNAMKFSESKGDKVLNIDEVLENYEGRPPPPYQASL